MFRKNYAAPGPGIDPDAPEKTGLARFFEILQLECGDLLKLNLLFLLSCLPVLTIPSALFAMNQVVRKMVLDEPVDCFYHYRTAFRAYWRQGCLAFAAGVLPLLLSAGGLLFYLGRAGSNPLFLLSFAVCFTVFLICLLCTPYLYGLLGEGRTLREAAALALVLGVGRPARSVPAALGGFGLAAVGILAFPVSGVYLLFIGFSFPCLLCNFFIRTVLNQYRGG